MDIGAVLTKMVQEQQDYLKKLQAKNEKLEQRLLALEGTGETGRRKLSVEAILVPRLYH
jgi:hypothetical protein